MTARRCPRVLAPLLAALLALAALPAVSLAETPSTGSGQSGQRCFPETGFCVEGRIRQFWEQNGGLRVFGLPIAPQQPEQIEGRSLQVQWFERNRLELHPENAPPYDVLLGRLGADVLAHQGRDPFTFPRSGPQQGCRFFPATRQNICGEILAAWRASGLEFDGRRGKSEAESLALFGLPLSDQMQESVEGKQYTVQWFERARFELHPESAPPYNVLLGLLGSELRGGPALRPLPLPSPGMPPIDLSPDEVSARLRVPERFVVRGFAAGLDTPRLMANGPDGALYVAERGAGRVVRLPDRDGDGRADTIEPVVSGLTAPHNMEWIAGCLYVAENDEVSRHCDADGDGSLERHARIVELPGGGGHTTRTLHAGPDGKLYVSVGSSCNVCAERDPRRAAILRFELDGSIPLDNPFVGDPDVRRRAVWAEGLRNSIDFVFMPDGQLWANHNGRDNMIDARAKDERPLEELVIAVQGGKHHGWPFCTTERPDGSLTPGAGPYVEVPDPSGDVPPAPAGYRCADAVPALFTGLAHSAPIGIARYDGSLFPPDYAGDVFVALHGSWNRTPPAPCKVVRILVENGQPVAAQDFLEGFQDRPDQGCGVAWGRPAGVTMGADAALYVSDDVNGRVYRIGRGTQGGGETTLLAPRFRQRGQPMQRRDEARLIVALAENAVQKVCGRKLALGEDWQCDQDGFIIRLDPSGSLTYASYLGGNGQDEVVGLAVDAAGAMYLTGGTTATDFPTTAGAFQPHCPLANPGDGCSYDAFVAKLAPDGSSLVYSTYLASDDLGGLDYPAGIAVDGQGNATVVGTTASAHWPTKSPIQATLNAFPCPNAFQDRLCFDSYITTLTPDGQLAFSSYLGGKLMAVFGLNHGK